MSDLHVDFPGAAPIPPLADGADLVMVAGDTCEGLVTAVELLRDAFAGVDVVMVGGNHEHYGRALGEELEAGRRRALSLGIHLLEDDTVTFGDVTVVGATLWTDYELFGEPLRSAAMHAAADGMRDHRKIKWRRRLWQRFRPVEARQLHLQSRRFIETAVSEEHDAGRKVAVVTTTRHRSKRYTRVTSEASRPPPTRRSCCRSWTVISRGGGFRGTRITG